MRPLPSRNGCTWLSASSWNARRSTNRRGPGRAGPHPAPAPYPAELASRSTGSRVRSRRVLMQPRHGEPDARRCPDSTTDQDRPVSPTVGACWTLSSTPAARSSPAPGGCTASVTKSGRRAAAGPGVAAADRGHRRSDRAGMQRRVRPLHPAPPRRPDTEAPPGAICWSNGVGPAALPPGSRCRADRCRPALPTSTAEPLLQRAPPCDALAPPFTDLCRSGATHSLRGPAGHR